MDTNEKIQWLLARRKKIEEIITALEELHRTSREVLAILPEQFSQGPVKGEDSDSAPIPMGNIILI